MTITHYLEITKDLEAVGNQFLLFLTVLGRKLSYPRPPLPPLTGLNQENVQSFTKYQSLTLLFT